MASVSSHAFFIVEYGALNMEKIKLVSDYMEGCCPEILKRFSDINMEKNSGYGTDVYSESARQKIRAACEAPDAAIYFLVGGTQTNETVISSVLRSYEGVLAADTGHVNTHEAGAIEHGGHKVLTLPAVDGKISAAMVEDYMKVFFADANHEHEVAPGMIYISQPTEYGTLYTLSELTELRKVADRYELKVFVDGARLGYGLAAARYDSEHGSTLAAPDDAVDLPALARLSDVYYIGGTKVGALFGEAVVFPHGDIVPHFYTITKQHGAMLAKGWLTGIQFDTLFSDDRYVTISMNAIACARKIRNMLLDCGYELYIDSPTNQIFPVVTDDFAAKLSETVDYGFMNSLPGGKQVIRFCTSWATPEDDVDRLSEIIRALA